MRLVQLAAGRGRRAAVEQVEDLDKAAWRRHVGVGGDQRRNPQTPNLLGEVEARSPSSPAMAMWS
jgi:hypothetical protein